MLIVTYKKTPGEGEKIQNAAYRCCAQYAAKRGMLITHVLPYTDDTHDDVLLHIAYLISAAQGTPNDLIAYEADDVMTTSNKDIMLPLTQAGLVNLHLAHFSLEFDQHSNPDHMERGAFKKLEEQAFWADLFDGYDSKLPTADFKKYNL